MDTNSTQRRRAARPVATELTDTAPSSWLERHPFAGFVAVAYAISWTCWAAAWVIGESFLAGFLVVVGGFGPAIAAGVMLRARGEPLRPWLRRIVHWRVSPAFWAYAVGLPFALFGAVNLALAAMGEPVQWSLLGGRLLPYLGTFLVVALIWGGQEEPGWRGYALPLLEARHGPIRATLMVGLVWGVWHTPRYGLAGFAVPLVLAFFYTWLFNRTGSVLLPIVLHGGMTAGQDNLVLLAEETHGVTDATMGLAYLLGVAIVLLATRGRLGWSDSAPPDPPAP